MLREVIRDLRLVLGWLRAYGLSELYPLDSVTFGSGDQRIYKLLVSPIMLLQPFSVVSTIRSRSQT